MTIEENKNTFERQISSLTQQQIVDVDVHIAHQPPDLIPSYHKQLQSSISLPPHSKSTNILTSKGGKEFFNNNSPSHAIFDQHHSEFSTGPPPPFRTQQNT
ncbi:unnamed protein product [Adineta steineri]|uniref:Uncharacterized protein n=1 Tax=Adineta steineri TaxID=433720 RepID=A0A814C5U4_9BILA|nr:unnamed protein product [Adineta steineri]CAF3780084.1 unnamed protein product [Adineta steineri]